MDKETLSSETDVEIEPEKGIATPQEHPSCELCGAQRVEIWSVGSKKPPDHKRGTKDVFES